MDDFFLKCSIDMMNIEEGDSMNREILEFIEENDVKFIRLGFCSPLGQYKNISIMADKLEEALESGISFDASAIEGFSDVNESDLFLFPDLKTLGMLPWRPNVNSVMRLYCDIKKPDKTDFQGDSRNILKQAIREMEKHNIICKIGTEFEFHLLHINEKGEPTDKPIDKGGYFDTAPLDKGGSIRREICLCLEEMGLVPEASHHEQGHGQNEIDFRFTDALTSADNFLTFKSVVKSIASMNGLFASFMPKPFLDQSGNGMHTNISLHKNGKNIFSDVESEDYQIAKQFIAGILDKAAEITLFLNPNNNSYERLGECEAPKYISWSNQNRSQLIRIPAANNKNERMELRSPDPTINPYIAFALIIQAGLSGIEEKMLLPEAVDENLYLVDKSVIKNLKKLPDNLGEAIELAENSKFVNEILDQKFLRKYLEIKKKEYEVFLEARDKKEYYKEAYFEIF